jgi:hypothetical protein
MSNENPTENPREAFDENEAGIEQKKQEMTDAVAAGDFAKVAELAQEAKGMEAAKAEMVGNAYDEATEMNKGIDEAKAAEEKVAREAALAEQAKQDAENSQKEAAALLEKMQGGPAENSAEQGQGEKISEELGNSLKEVFDEWHLPQQNSDTREIIGMRWREISNEIMSKLNDLDDFKEYAFFLRDKNEAFYEKWNALSAEEVNNATTEEEIKKAVDHLYGHGRTSRDLRDTLEKKYQALTGKPYPIDYSGMHLGRK